MTGSTARVTFTGPNRLVSTWARKSSGRDLLEEPGVEVAGVVDQHVDAAEPLDPGVDRGLRAGRVGDVQGDGQQVVVLAEGLRDLVGVAGGGDDLVAGVQGGAGDVDAHAAAGSGDQDDLLVCHVELLLLLRRGGPRSAGAVCLDRRHPENAACRKAGTGPLKEGYSQRPFKDAHTTPTLGGMDDKEAARAAVREFLSSRRDRVSPADAGLPVGGTRRRVKGLRREEVALLAGVSPEYYIRLERGQATGPSASVVESVAAVLRLDDDERRHLDRLLAALTPEARKRREAAVKDTVCPGIRVLLDSMGHLPAVVFNSRLDVLAANELGRALYAPLFDTDGPPNAACSCSWRSTGPDSSSRRSASPATRCPSCASRPPAGSTTRPWSPSSVSRPPAATHSAPAGPPTTSGRTGQASRSSGTR